MIKAETVTCPYCGEGIEEEQLNELILRRCIERKKEMERTGDCITDKAQYLILREIIRALSPTPTDKGGE